jgi:predicted transcriptional regulator
MNKSRVMELLKNLPEEITVEELIQKLLLIEKVEKGLKDAEEGRTISFEEVNSRFEKRWQENR